MKYNNSRAKAVLVLGVVGWISLFLGIRYVYHETTQQQERSFRPTSVQYGTHSSATMPSMVQPSYTLHRTPYTVHHTPYTAHHTPSASSGFKIHTTSSAQVQHIGSGGGGGIATTNGISSSRRGITYGGASVSMPTLALVTPTYAYAAQERNAILGPRRINSDGTGEYEGEPSADGNQYWDGEGWVNYNEGDTRFNTTSGKWQVYKDGDWVDVSDQADPTIPQPVGATPWAVMAVLALVYTSRKRSVKGELMN